MKDGESLYARWTLCNHCPACCRPLHPGTPTRHLKVLPSRFPANPRWTPDGWSIEKWGDGSIDPLLSVRRFAMIQVTAVWANDYLDIFRGIPNSGTIWNHMEPCGTKPYGTIISTCQSCHPFDTLGALAWLDDMSWASGVTLRNLPRSQEICWKLQWGTAVGTCLFIKIAYAHIYIYTYIALPLQMSVYIYIYNKCCMYVCVCYSIWMCIDVQFMGGILTLVFWDKKMVSQIISLLSNMVWPSSQGNSPMELRIQWMHLEREQQKMAQTLHIFLHTKLDQQKKQTYGISAYHITNNIDTIYCNTNRLNRYKVAKYGLDNRVELQ